MVSGSVSGVQRVPNRAGRKVESAGNVVLVLRPPANAVCAGHSHEAEAEREGNCGNDDDAQLREAAGFLVPRKQHVAVHRFRQRRVRR